MLREREEGKGGREGERKRDPEEGGRGWITYRSRFIEREVDGWRERKREI